MYSRIWSGRCAETEKIKERPKFEAAKARRVGTLKCYLGATACQYRLSIFPVVKDDDARRNRYADFSILKIKDSLTWVVIEAKLNISETVNYGMRNDRAQLVLETIYSDQQENNRQEKTLCGLTNGTTWHIFVVNMRTRSLDFLFYGKATEPEYVCSTISRFLQKGTWVEAVDTPKCHFNFFFIVKYFHCKVASRQNFADRLAVKQRARSLARKRKRRQRA